MSELGVNKVNLIGRSGVDAALKFTQGGKPEGNFSRVVNESFKSRDGNKKGHVEWFNCVWWGKLGEVDWQYVTKGKQLFLEGRLQLRKYDARKGNPREVVEVVVTLLRLISGNGNRNGNGETREAVPGQPGPDKGQSCSSGCLGLKAPSGKAWNSFSIMRTPYLVTRVYDFRANPHSSVSTKIPLGAVT
jgi:single-strand DNA-binding protein